MKKLVLTIAVWVLVSTNAIADVYPEYEGVYIRTHSGELIDLGEGYDKNSIPSISFRTSTVCERCIALQFDGPSLKTFPPGAYANFLLIDNSDIKGFVIKQRAPVQSIFLDGLGQIKELTNGQLMPKDPSQRQLGENYAFVYGAFRNGRNTTELDSSAYSFTVVRRSTQKNSQKLSPSSLPPFLSLSGCGFSPRNGNFKTKLIDQFTTEFVFDLDFSQITATNKVGRCGSNQIAWIYGNVLEVRGRYYPFSSEEFLEKYMNTFRDKWPIDIRVMLPDL